MSGSSPGDEFNRWRSFERVIVLRAFDDHDNQAALAALDAEVEARLVAPAERNGSKRTGAALLTTHQRLGTTGAERLRQAIGERSFYGHRNVIEGVLWHGLGLNREQVQLLSGYSFINGLATACVRLGRLGALNQQQVVAQLLPVIESIATLHEPVLPCLSAFNPLADVAMMRHPGRSQTLFAS